MKSANGITFNLLKASKTTHENTQHVLQPSSVIQTEGMNILEMPQANITERK